ncbi:haloacid dehalogenase [Saccharomonospora piscinae]|uniref:Haloacid dehalogenase n=1 Tax=Saccharomonospora piscinae TaxID=687388 RepID=A0A1V9A5L4_SACPI|nr:HAD-IA family hydrolase [Saccharomonospora piscinae]OQO92373.1 haloacid dehalogenase [Saccharomonospora piscinae]
MIRGLVFDHAGVLTDVGAERLVRAALTAREKGLRTALLSNASGGPEARRGLGWLDVVVFSGEVGLAKPAPEVYRLTAARLGVGTAECVFVDDAPRNVAGAVAVGMVGVRHVSVENTIAELAALIPGLESATA